MKQFILLAAIAISVVACDSMKGDLSVKSSITLEKKSGLFGRKREAITVEEGQYDAVLNPTSKKNVNLVIKVDGKKAKIPFTLPEGSSVPTYAGELTVVSADSGQPYDLNISTTSHSRDSSPYSRNESCVLRYDSVYRCHTEPGETECRTVPSPRNCSRDSDGNVTCSGSGTTQVCHTRPGHEVCGYENVAVYGSQVVNYVTRTTYTDVVATLLEGDAKLANFNHSGSSSSTYTVGSSSCY